MARWRDPVSRNPHTPRALPLLQPMLMPRGRLPRLFCSRVPLKRMRCTKLYRGRVRATPYPWLIASRSACKTWSGIQQLRASRKVSWERMHWNSLENSRKICLALRFINFYFTDRITKHLLKVYGPRSSHEMIVKHASSKSRFFKLLVCQTISRLFKYPDQAFATLDFTGKGYLEPKNIYEHALLYSTPFTKAELKDFCENNAFTGH